MRVLAIDTALGACSAAVLDTERGTLTEESVPMERGHAEALMPLIARVMGQSGMTFADLERVAVTTGPGSFTGLRVGISAARGISLAAKKPAIGLTTLSAYAAPYIHQDDTLPVTVAIDARHDHVYLQIFGPGGRVLVAPRIASLREAAKMSANGTARLVGNGAAMVASAWPANEAPPKLVEVQAAPDIKWVARIGVASSETQGPPRPLYLRQPDAQPQDAARLPRR
jgi:tRNA threonylcarbamoyl adenosine modification protein YeaZ